MTLPESDSKNSPVSAKKALLWSIAIYVAACILPALVFHIRHDVGRGGYWWGKYRSERGVSLLVSGLLFGWLRMNFTAFANPLLWCSWIFYARRHFAAARAFSLAALILSLETLQFLVQPRLWDESATEKGFLAAPHIGFVLWIASMIIIFWTSRRAVV